MTTAPTPLARPARAQHLAIDNRLRQLLWLLAAAAVGFAVPYVFADRLEVQRDVYYAIYVVAVLGFFLAWTRANGLSLLSMLARNLRWALVLGILAGTLLAAIALGYDSTAHPGGLRLAGAILWRGVVYGAADGLLLGAFPVLAVFAAFPFVRGRAHLLRTIATGVLALVAAVALTAAYHLGYPDFRGSKVTAPMRGALVWTMPSLLTLNPIGSVVAHVELHVAAVVHSYDGDTFLPPHRAAAPTIALHRCTFGEAGPAECGTLRVAENPSDPNGAQIGLKVAVFRAYSDDPAPDPVFWFAGWGSGGVTDDAAGVTSAFTALRWDHDLVFVDQRGTGSSKLTCPTPAGLLTSSPAAVTRAARRCAERIGPNLRYYTSAVAVDDFDRVRQALGYDKIDIYGGSYGVTTGQIYLLRHGSHVRTAVFDSGSLLDVHIFERQLVNKQRALERLFARCAADRACHAAFPNLRREYAQTVARLARHPVAVPGAARRLDPAAFATVLDDLIAYTPGKALAPRLIHLVARGQIARAAAAAPKSSGQEDLAYQLLIQCNEPWASWRRGEIERLSRGSFLAPAFRQAATTIAAVCAGFPKADVPKAIGQRVHSTVPILFLAGAEDGADPPANIADARRELPNSRTVIFPAAGHGQLGFRCTQGLVADFVTRGTAAGLDASCAQNAAVQPFDTRR